MSKKSTSFDVKELRELLVDLLTYDPETGDFFWKRPAGGFSPNGYRYIKVGAKQCLAHRLAWLYVHGEWPDALIDHIDGNRSNNRIGNLRKATHSQNGANAKRHSRNRSGYKGVSFDKSKNRWQASITVQNKQIHLGRFKTKDEARAAYMTAAKFHHGEFANDGENANVVNIKGVAA